MMESIETREILRNGQQSELDKLKTQAERNRLGQFSTPSQLAREVLAYGLSLLPTNARVRFLDPAIGTGSFYSALEAMRGDQAIQWARGFEVDPHYGAPAQALWRDTPLEITLADFTQKAPPDNNADKANLLICNPPYVRHHHLDAQSKIRLHRLAKERAHVELSGLSGLYCYFMALAHSWMSEGAVGGWLIPSEFMDVNYGRAIKQYLLRSVTLLHIHRFDPNEVQFQDALVSSAVVWFTKAKPPSDHRVMFSYGGSLQAPKIVKRVSGRDLERTEKWTRFPRNEVVTEYEGYCLGDLFTIKRGLATGDNSFFIVDEDKAASFSLSRRLLRPILPSTKHIKIDEVEADEDGIPKLEKRLFLIDCDLPQDELERDHPKLWEYLQSGVAKVSGRYLCRTRRYWYSQEKRPAAPIICTYLGRSDHERRPFRFILNHSRATATNVYLMLYPKAILAKLLSSNPGALRALWKGLNDIHNETLLNSGRVYGGGLHKLEPRELANVPVDSLATAVGLVPRRAITQLDLN